MGKNIRIIVLGDPRVGKTSIISTFISDYFPDNVDPVLCEVVIPAECSTNNCSLTIVDSSSVEDDHDITCEQIRLADVIIIVYSSDIAQSWEHVKTKWIPLVNDICEDDKPIIIVGNKLDLMHNPSTINKSTHLKDHAEPILTKYPNVDSCMECSAKTRQNIRDLFYIAQRAISFPSLPLFDKTTQTLSHTYTRILRRIFRFFDRDCDGLWSPAELNLFQKQSYATQLSSQEIDSLLFVLKQSNAESFVQPLRSARDEGITEEGFLELMKLFLRRDRPESNWVMLRSLGYNDDLSWKVQASDISIQSKGRRCEWSEEGLVYLLQIAALYDQDHDGVLTSDDLQRMFAPLPDSLPLWESCSSLFLSPLFPDNVETTPSGGITYNTFVGLWSLLLRYESTLTLYTLLQLGYWKDYHVLIRWVSKDQRDRRFVHCCVVGDDQVGKSSFIQALKSDKQGPFSPIAMPIQSYLCSLQNAEYHYLLLTEVSCNNTDGVWQCLEVCDLCIMLFDTTDPSSFNYCGNLQAQMNDKGVVYIGTKADLLQTSFNMTELHEQIQSYCKDYSLMYPQLISLKGDKQMTAEQMEELKQKLFEMGVNPASCVPETYQQRRSRLVRKTIQITSGLTLIAGAVAGMVYMSRSGMKWR